MTQRVLDKIDYPPFKALALWDSGKSQTLLTSIYPSSFDSKPTKTHHLKLEDQDTLVVMEYTPDSWQDGDRIIILVHGLTGAYDSKYNIRMTKRLMAQKCAVIRVNLRGCGPGSGLARHPYHSGRSEDTRAIIRWLKELYPNSPVTQIGFSLGGNITLKMAAEDSSQPTGNLDSVIAVSPPVDLHACSALLHKPENQMFERYFVKNLLEDVKTRKKHFPDIPDVSLSLDMSLLEFDNTYTAPFSGFRDATDYYTQSSSGRILNKIAIPCLILYAKDDPFITIERFLTQMRASHFDCIVTEQGGHVAWFGPLLGSSPHYWMDGALDAWLRWFVDSKE